MTGPKSEDDHMFKLLGGPTPCTYPPPPHRPVPPSPSSHSAVNFTGPHLFCFCFQGSLCWGVIVFKQKVLSILIDIVQSCFLEPLQIFYSCWSRCKHCTEMVVGAVANIVQCCACVHMHVCVCMKHMHTHTNTDIYECMHAYIYLCLYVCV